MSVRALQLPVVPMSRRQELKLIDVPWLIRSLLHSGGTKTERLRIGQFLRLDDGEREELRKRLLKQVNEINLVAEINRFIDELKKRRI